MHVSMKLLAGALALGLSACALDSPARAPSLSSPSHPDAAESPVLDMAAMLVTRDAAPQAPPAPTPAPAASDAGTPSTAVYTCPMHPEVTSPAPGHCPKCGMTLVLRQGPAPRGDKP